jgi:hypothetical protein
MSSAGMGRAKVRLSHAQLRTLTAHGSLRVRVPLTFAPVIGPNATRWLTLLFRPARHPGRAYTVTLLRR